MKANFFLYFWVSLYDINWQIRNLMTPWNFFVSFLNQDFLLIAFLPLLFDSFIIKCCWNWQCSFSSFSFDPKHLLHLSILFFSSNHFPPIFIEFYWVSSFIPFPRFIQRVQFIDFRFSKNAKAESLKWKWQ